MPSWVVRKFTFLDPVNGVVVRIGTRHRGQFPEQVVRTRNGRRPFDRRSSLRSQIARASTCWVEALNIPSPHRAARPSSCSPCAPCSSSSRRRTVRILLQTKSVSLFHGEEKKECKFKKHLQLLKNLNRLENCNWAHFHLDVLFNVTVGL